MTRLLHPEILSALGEAGHGSRVLLADGNYPFSTGSPAGARKVFLNLRRGLVRVTDLLEVLTETIPIESALMMSRPDSEPVPIHAEFKALLPGGVILAGKPRLEFYEEAKSHQTALVIATGEERRFANLLLTIGVIRSHAP